MEYNSRLHQAISLALCLVEWEIEEPTGPGREDWRSDLVTARDTLKAAHKVLERARPPTTCIVINRTRKRVATSKNIEQVVRQRPELLELSIRDAAQQAGCSPTVMWTVRQKLLNHKNSGN